MEDTDFTAGRDGKVTERETVEIGGDRKGETGVRQR
jgi:hypothetical protein